MTRKEIISGLKFTLDMFLFDPRTGETLTEPRNNMDKTTIDACRGAIELLEQEPKTRYCKKCKYFEYDSVAMVDGIPLIVAHEICSKWGDGCKTKEDGYCFMFEPQESEGKE